MPTLQSIDEYTPVNINEVRAPDLVKMGLNTIMGRNVVTLELSESGDKPIVLVFTLIGYGQFVNSLVEYICKLHEHIRSESHGKATYDGSGYDGSGNTSDN